MNEWPPWPGQAPRDLPASAVGPSELTHVPVKRCSSPAIVGFTCSTSADPRLTVKCTNGGVRGNDRNDRRIFPFVPVREDLRRQEGTQTRGQMFGIALIEE